MHKLPVALATILIAALTMRVIGATEDQSQPTQTTDPAFIMTVMDAFKISGKGVALTGRIENGIVRAGDSVCLTAAKIGRRTLTVNAIELGSNTPDSAKQGDIVGILVNGIDKGDISRGGSDKLTASCAP